MLSSNYRTSPGPESELAAASEMMGQEGGKGGGVGT